jgi:hypothetical protein
MFELVCTIILAIIPPLAVAIIVYLLNERSKRNFEKAKKKYDIKLERYEQLSNSLYKMVSNLERLKLLITTDWDNIHNLENNIVLAYSMGIMSIEDERILGTEGVKKTFKQYNKLIKKIDPESKEGKEKLLEWMLILINTLIWLRLRLFDVIEHEFWKGHASLELIDREKKIHQKTFDVGKMVFEEAVKSLSKYELNMRYTIDVEFIDRITDELRTLREMMLDDIEKTL